MKTLHEVMEPLKHYFEYTLCHEYQGTQYVLVRAAKVDVISGRNLYDYCIFDLELGEGWVITTQIEPCVTAGHKWSQKFKGPFFIVKRDQAKYEDLYFVNMTKNTFSGYSPTPCHIADRSYGEKKWRRRNFSRGNKELMKEYEE